MPVSALFAHPQSKPSAPIVIVPAPPAAIQPATTTPSLPIAPDVVSTPPKKIAAPVAATSAPTNPMPHTVFIVPNQTAPQVSTSSLATSIISTSTPSVATGTTTLTIQSVPLLSGGVVHAGQSVPISYLEIINIGTSSAQLTGFWVKQNGSASTDSVVGLSTVDDKGGSQGLIRGAEGSALFTNGLAFAPTDTFFSPGQMRLFTIKAILAPDVTAYTGTALMIDVASIQTTATVEGNFPIRGTTWAISP